LSKRGSTWGGVGRKNRGIVGPKVLKGGGRHGDWRRERYGKNSKSGGWGDKRQLPFKQGSSTLVASMAEWATAKPKKTCVDEAQGSRPDAEELTPQGALGVANRGGIRSPGSKEIRARCHRQGKGRGELQNRQADQPKPTCVKPLGQTLFLKGPRGLQTAVKGTTILVGGIELAQKVGRSGGSVNPITARQKTGGQPNQKSFPTSWCGVGKIGEMLKPTPK